MSDLEKCYEKLKGIYGSEIEPLDVVEAVEKHRQFWRPAKVNVLLIAESHVYTKKNECAPCTYPDGLSNLPSDFVRFVYCLGYGEQDVAPTSVIKNPGTSQFWQIFYSCINRIEKNKDFYPVSKKTSFIERINNKYSLLSEMKEIGVWLLDSSVVGLYRPDDTSLDLNVRNKLVTESWKQYVQGIARSVKPKEVIVIGKGVWKNIQDNFNLDVRVTVLPQPNARLSNKERMNMFRDYYDICSN